MPREPWQDDPAEVARAKAYQAQQKRRARAERARLRALAGDRAARRRLAEQYAPLTDPYVVRDPQGRW